MPKGMLSGIRRTPPVCWACNCEANGHLPEYIRKFLYRKTLRDTAAPSVWGQDLCERRIDYMCLEVVGVGVEAMCKMFL